MTCEAILARTASAQISKADRLTILVGFPPGGPTDALARLLAEHLRRSTATVVVVENRPGAGGLVAALELSRVSPDGTVILLTPSYVRVLVPLTHSQPQFSAEHDLAPIGQIARYEQGFAVPYSHPAQTLREFAAWAKANPKLASFGSPAAGSIPHFVGFQLSRAIGVDLVHVPYRGSAPLANDIAGSQISAAADVLPELIPLHRAGRARILAVSGQRSRFCPDVPTFEEQGMPRLVGTGWFAVYAPASMEETRRNDLSRAIREALATPTVATWLLDRAYEPTGTGPDELERIGAADVERWRPIVRASGFKGD